MRTVRSACPTNRPQTSYALSHPSVNSLGNHTNQLRLQRPQPRHAPHPARRDRRDRSTPRGRHHSPRRVRPPHAAATGHRKPRNGNENRNWLGSRCRLKAKSEFITKVLPPPESLVQRSRLIRPKHPDIVPDVPWESAGLSETSAAAEGAKPPENAQAKGPRNTAQAKKLWRAMTALADIHRWGKSLRYQGQRGETKERGKTRSLRFTPFPFLELTLKIVCKGLIC